MKTVDETFFFNFEEKKSNFIAYLTPFKNFKPLLEQLKNQHPKARHFVTASRTFNKEGQIEESFSDDGEPKGTSGRPTLNVLQGNNLIEIGAITIRYFGGIKLGTGGLVRAYSDSLNTTISQANLIDYVVLEKESFNVLYSNISKFEYNIGQLNLNILNKEFNNEGGIFLVEGIKESLDELKRKV